jgi:hypothetical protein
MYLGFEGDASALFRTSRPRRAEQRSKGDAPVRSVYQVWNDHQMHRSPWGDPSCSNSVDVGENSCRLSHHTALKCDAPPGRGWSLAALAWARRRCWHGWPGRPPPAARAPAPPPPPARSTSNVSHDHSARWQLSTWWWLAAALGVCVCVRGTGYQMICCQMRLRRRWLGHRHGGHAAAAGAQRGRLLRAAAGRCTGSSRRMLARAHGHALPHQACQRSCMRLCK